MLNSWGTNFTITLLHSPGTNFTIIMLMLNFKHPAQRLRYSFILRVQVQTPYIPKMYRYMHLYTVQVQSRYQLHHKLLNSFTVSILNSLYSTANCFTVQAYHTIQIKDKVFFSHWNSLGKLLLIKPEAIFHIFSWHNNYLKILQNWHTWRWSKARPGQQRRILKNSQLCQKFILLQRRHTGPTSNIQEEIVVRILFKALKCRNDADYQNLTEKIRTTKSSYHEPSFELKAPQ